MFASTPWGTQHQSNYWTRTRPCCTWTVQHQRQGKQVHTLGHQINCWTRMKPCCGAPHQRQGKQANRPAGYWPQVVTKGTVTKVMVTKALVRCITPTTGKQVHTLGSEALVHTGASNRSRILATLIGSALTSKASDLDMQLQSYEIY